MPSLHTSSGSDIFLHAQAKRAGKIKGEAVSEGHKDDISVLSWSWGVASSSSIGTSGTKARRSYKSLVVRKGIDCASTALLNALASNDELREATLTMRKAGEGQQDYFRLTLKGARVTSIDMDTDLNGNTLEVVSISFTEVDIEYRMQQGTGSRGGAYTFNDQILPA
jgi:type VI secretion system secreted protein Hcp